jgi:hypothetical protein
VRSIVISGIVSPVLLFCHLFLSVHCSRSSAPAVGGRVDQVMPRG